MSHVNNLVHCVWGTKRRFPFINEQNRPLILGHIRKYADEHGIYIDFINAHKDHVHCIVSLAPTQSLSLVIKGLKGGTSGLIGASIGSGNQFSWASEYYAVSVGPGILDRVRDYIRDQDMHHAKRSWHEEEQEFLKTIDRYSQQFRWDKIRD